MSGDRAADNNLVETVVVGTGGYLPRCSEGSGVSDRDDVGGGWDGGSGGGGGGCKWVPGQNIDAYGSK